jgi:hypothetical protein
MLPSSFSVSFRQFGSYALHHALTPWILGDYKGQGGFHAFGIARDATLVLAFDRPAPGIS